MMEHTTDDTDRKLIEIAIGVANPVRLGDDTTAGGVAAALLGADGNIYTGVCIDTISGIGFCAEHNAIGAMITAGESKIKKIVAVWKNENEDAHILPPCGRCREFMNQVNPENLDTDVILAKDKVVKLADLLPHANESSKI